MVSEADKRDVVKAYNLELFTDEQLAYIYGVTIAEINEILHGGNKHVRERN
jgi:hypothetical protein